MNASRKRYESLGFASVSGSLKSSKATGICEVIEDPSWLGSTGMEMVKVPAQAKGIDVSDALGLEYVCFRRGTEG